MQNYECVPDHWAKPTRGEERHPRVRAVPGRLWSPRIAELSFSYFLSGNSAEHLLCFFAVAVFWLLNSWKLVELLEVA